MNGLVNYLADYCAGVSDNQLSLLLLGGSHVGDSSERVEFVKQQFDTIDIVFIECVTGDESLCTKVMNSLRAPLIVLGAIFVLGIESFADSVGKSDNQLKQQIVDDYDVEIVEIDRSFHPTIKVSPYFWPLSNYSLLLIVCMIYWRFGSPIVTLAALAYVTVVAFLLYLAATLYGRDAQMALDIEQYAQTHSGNACAIVGGHHEKGLIDRLTNSSNIHIISREN